MDLLYLIHCIWWKIKSMENTFLKIGMFVSDTVQISIYYRIVIFEIKAVHSARQRIENKIPILILKVFIK